MMSAKISRDEMNCSASQLRLVKALPARGRKNPYKLTRRQITLSLRRLLRAAQPAK
jgi:hypothetical protein